MFQRSVTPFRASQRRFSLYCGAALITLAAVSQTHAQSAPKETPLSVVRLIFGCRQQSAELANLPFDTIARIAAPDDAQHAALDALRGTAREAAERFASDCPQSVPAGPAVRLEAMEQAIDAARAAFNVVEPALQRFYSALDDEQKARLLRDITLADV